MKSDIYKRNVDTRDNLLARILDAASRKNKSEDQLRQQQTIFANELQIALKLTV
jgi:hypothetical protein